MVSVAIIMATIVLVMRLYRREAPRQPYENSIVSDYSYYANINEEHKRRAPKVRFYDRRNYEQRGWAKR